MRHLQFFLSILLLVIPCSADIITVNPNGTGDYPTIQAAINAANPGDEIVLEPGTYTGNGNRDIDFLGKAIIVRSTDPNDPDVVAATIINPNGTEEEPHRGFYFSSAEDENSVLEGLTITNGYGLDDHEGPFGEVPFWNGGGICCDSSSPKITNCVFSGNSAKFGGGLANWNGSNPKLTNCEFTENWSGVGGGTWNCYSNPTVNNCTFTGNSAMDGAGMFNYEGSSPALTNCMFIGNSGGADGGGGGMSNWGGSSPTVTNCTFSGNLGPEGGGGMWNGYGSRPTLTNCVFSGNSAVGGTNPNFYIGGGMLNCENTSPTLTNCTFAGNSAVNGNALACDSAEQQPYPSTVQLANCILWDGGDEIWNNDGSTITVTYSCVQDADPDDGSIYPGTGNIDDDPLFIGPNGLDRIPGTADDEDANVHLRGYSPCINTGDPGGDYSGQVDIDNQPRVAYGRVDMGADEVFPIAGDFEPDEDVDLADFAISAINWLIGVEELPPNLAPYPSTGVIGDPAKWDPQDIGGFTGEPHEWPDGQCGYVHYMRADTGIDPEGGAVYYYFDRVGEPENSGWQFNREWSPSVPVLFSPYSYTVKYGDAPDGGNVSDPCPVTPVIWEPPPNLPPYPSTGVVGDPAKWDPIEINGYDGQPREWDVGGGDYRHYMRADIAIDPECASPVYYYFDRVVGEPENSGWQTSREWLSESVPYHSPYSYTVKYGDAPDGGNVSDPCPPTPVIW